MIEFYSIYIFIFVMNALKTAVHYLKNEESRCIFEWTHKKVI